MAFFLKIQTMGILTVGLGIPFLGPQKVFAQDRMLSYETRTSLQIPGASGDTDENSKVWMKGNASRTETSMGSQSFVIVTKDGKSYKLDPSAKTAEVLDNVSPTASPQASGGTSSDSSALPDRDDLLKEGAKLTGTEPINGEIADVYTLPAKSTPISNRTSGTAWVSKASGRMLKEEESDLIGGKYIATITIDHIKEESSLPDNLFEVPPDYKMAE